MNTDQLQYFVATAGCGSMNHAASSLFVSRQGLSSAIQSLEQELGVKLFDRNKTGVTLTDEGTIVYNMALNILEEVHRAQGELHHHSTKISFRVLVSIGLDVSYLSGSINHFKALHPNVSVIVQNVTSVEALRMLEKGDADMGFVGIPNEQTIAFPKSIAILGTYTETLSVVVPFSHPLAKRTTVSLDDMVRYPIVLHESSDAGNPFSIRRWLTSLYPQANIVLSTDNATTHNDAVAQGIGIGFLSGVVTHSPNVMRKINEMNLQVVPLSDGIVFPLFFCANADSLAQKESIIKAFGDEIASQFNIKRQNDSAF